MPFEILLDLVRNLSSVVVEEFRCLESVTVSLQCKSTDPVVVKFPVSLNTNWSSDTITLYEYVDTLDTRAARYERMEINIHRSGASEVQGTP